MQPTKLPIETLTTAEHFWAFFSAIPEEKWCKGDYQIGIQYCALGHLGERHCTPTALPCSRLERILDVSAADINDGRHPGYQQPTPKQRILAALADKMEVRP